MVQPRVTLCNETILFPLPFGHRNQDAAFLVLGRIAKQFVHLRPKALLFVKQWARIMRCTAAITSGGFPTDDELVEYCDLDPRTREPPARTQARNAAADDDNFRTAHVYIPV